MEKNEPHILKPESDGAGINKEGETEEAESFAEAFNEEYLKNLTSFNEGEIVEGVIAAVSLDSVFVDIGFKSEGEIPLSEFDEKPSRGDKVSVMIIRMENREGKLVISKKRADEVVMWNNIRNAFKEELPIEGTITEQTKGGMTVSLLGFKAFCPISQLDKKKVVNPQNYIGKKFLFRIERMKGKNDIVVSHRKYLEEQKIKNIEEFFRSNKPGDILEGTVKDIVNYGAFINVGEIDGLLHTSDISWGKNVDPYKHLRKGEKIRCIILSMDKKNKKVSLGMKQLVPDPWVSFEERYKKGQRYKGKVTKLTNFGAFVELEEGIEGLLHVSELSWTKRIKHPKEVLHIGDEVETMLLNYDLSKRNVSLGLKQILPNPWDDIEVRFPIGSRVTGKITRITKFGLFLELDNGIEGLLHIDDISWTKNKKGLTDSFKPGQQLDVMIIDINKEEKKVQLGLKQLAKNPWKSLKEEHPKGSIITGTITSITDFGVFVKIDEDIEGLIPISQLSHDHVDDPSQLYKVGDKIKAAIMAIDDEKRKVTLSIKEYLNHLEYQEIEKYIDTSEEDMGSVPLGSLIDLKKIGH